MHALTPREHEVLRTIMEDYISTAQPVGSRAVSKRSGLKLSPASMRNVMADLTDKGFPDYPQFSASLPAEGRWNRVKAHGGLPWHEIQSSFRRG